MSDVFGIGIKRMNSGLRSKITPCDESWRKLGAGFHNNPAGVEAEVEIILVYFQCSKPHYQKAYEFFKNNEGLVRLFRCRN